MSDEKFFISYSNKDRDQVYAVVEKLKDCGLNVWIDQEQIQMSDNIVRKIDAGIAEAKYFILFASKSYFESNWAKTEYESAFYVAINSNEKKIIVILLDNVKLPSLIAPRNNIRWTHPVDVALKIAEYIKQVDLSQIASIDKTAIDTSTREDHGESVPWNNVQDYLVDVLIEQMLNNLGDILTQPGPIVPYTLKISNEKSVTLHISKVLAQNDALMADLRNEYQVACLVREIIGEYRKTLTTGGLGILTPAFKIALRENQEKLDGSRFKLREQLSAVSPEISIRTN